jgi:hypothetical protein
MSSRDVFPATQVSSEDALMPEWLIAVSRRIYELSRRPEGWDSYGARALADEAARTLYDMLKRLRYAIQSQPLISLNDEGGLVAEWEGSHSSLELSVNPGNEVVVYHHDFATNRESELPASQCDLLDKWLWSASSQV